MASNNIKPSKYPVGPDEQEALFDQAVEAGRAGKQDTLVSGTNIKTINGTSVLGSGDLTVSASGATWGSITGTLSAQSDLSTALSGKASTGAVTGTGITMSTARILGRITAGTGAIEEITVGTGLTLSAGTLSASGGGLTVGTTAIASGTIGRVLFQGTGNVLQQSANLFWDNTNSRLGIGTASPNMSLDIRTGNVGIGVTSDAGFKLDVNGTARVQDNFRVTKNGNNYIDLVANTNGSSPYIDLFYSGTVAARINSFATQGGSFANGSGYVFGNTAGTSQNTRHNNIMCDGLTEIKSNLYLSGASGNRIQFFEPGIAYRGNIGVKNGTNYIQIRTNSATNLTDGTLSTIFDNAGSVGIGGITTVNASSVLELSSTSKGFLPPRMTNAQMLAIAAPAAGLVVYDTTNNKHVGYDGTAWQNFY